MAWRLQVLDLVANALPGDQPPVHVRRRQQRREQGDTIRVFVSSPFRDFGRERDYLNSFIFPKLKQLCLERGVFLIPVDLRWGVTAEESARGDVIKLCLEEIDACHPWFIGMLGERYGWHRVPDQPPDDCLEETFRIGAEHFPWVARYPQASVTELELRHVINDISVTDQPLYASFYLRDTPGFLEREEVPKLERPVYQASGRCGAWGEPAAGGE